MGLVNCPSCKGKGKRYRKDFFGRWITSRCDRCYGQGKISKENAVPMKKRNPQDADTPFTVGSSCPKSFIDGCKKFWRAIEAIETDNDGHWIYLNEGWWSPDMGCRTIHEDTVAEALKKLRRVETDEQDDEVPLKNGPKRRSYEKASEDADALTQSTGFPHSVGSERRTGYYYAIPSNTLKFPKRNPRGRRRMSVNPPSNGFAEPALKFIADYLDQRTGTSMRMTILVPERLFTGRKTLRDQVKRTLGKGRILISLQTAAEAAANAPTLRNPILV